MFRRFYFIHLLMFLVILLTACLPSVSSTTEPPVVAISTIPANTASVSGIVWHDLCALVGGEGGTPVQPSAGCVSAIEGSFKANGTREADEPGLEGIVVLLGYGSCDTVVEFIETKTNASGAYAFTNLPAGAYCVKIDSLRPENVSLLPGQWTLPVETKNAGVSSITVNLMGSEQKAAVDFGWDYQFLPVPPASESNSPVANGKVNAQGLNLRAGPGLGHRILLELDEETLLEIKGRSENNEWLLVQLQSGTQGWVYYEYVDTQVVIANLPLREAYGGAYLAPTATTQDEQPRHNVRVSIENNVAIVNIAGFHANNKLVVTLERSDGKGGLVVGKDTTNENGNVRILFDMPSEWADGKPLTSGDLTLVVSSKDGKMNIRATIQYYR